MIRERDLERNEMAALSNRCELAEAKATQLESAKTLVNQQLEALKVMLEKTEAKFKVADGTINDLTVQLKEKKDVRVCLYNYFSLTERNFGILRHSYTHYSLVLNTLELIL